jgi:hypothetical protein
MAGRAPAHNFFADLDLSRLTKREQQRNRSRACIPSIKGGKVNIHLQGRKITIEQGHQPLPVETLRLIRKLRRIKMEEEAEQLQWQSASTGGVITVVRETD